MLVHLTDHTILQDLNCKLAKRKGFLEMLFEISKRISRNVVRVLLKIEHNFYKFYSNAFLTTRTGFLEMLFNQVECVCIVCVSCVSVLVPLNLSNRISRNSVRLLKNFFYR